MVRITIEAIFSRSVNPLKSHLLPFEPRLNYRQISLSINKLSINILDLFFLYFRLNNLRKTNPFIDLLLNKEPVEVFSLLELFFDRLRQIDDALYSSDQFKEGRGCDSWEVVARVKEQLVKGFDDDLV